MLGIDLARFVAIVGMMAAHLLPAEGVPSWIHTVTSGFPSTLFAVLGGFGVVFASGRYLRAGKNWAAFLSIFTRGLVVLLLGLAMELLPPHPIAVILVYFGASLMCAALLLRVPSTVLAVAAAVLAVVGPLANQTIRQLPSDSMTLGGLDLSSLSSAFLSVFIKGTYPVLTWIVYLMIGMVLARMILRARRTGRLPFVSLWMTVTGAAVCAGSWIFSHWYTTEVATQLSNAQLSSSKWLLLLEGNSFGAPATGGWNAILLASPHSGATMDIIRTVSAAVMVIGLALLSTYRLRSVPLLLRPILAMGAAPLTLYTLHIVATSLTYMALGTASQPTNLWLESGLGSFGLQLGMVLAVGIVLAILGRRGPLEFLVSRVAQWSASLVVRPRDKNEPPSSADQDQSRTPSTLPAAD